MRLLFVGNSFSARNDLPGVLARLAAARGVDLEHDLLSIGGASLRTHWNKPATHDAIRSGRYDHIVLQEQSTLPVKNPKRMHENVRLFDGLIRESGAKTVLYATWARRDTPEHQSAISDAYAAIAAELDALLVPVGDVWRHVLKCRESPVLHDRDGSHPSVAGTYLAACTFVRVLLKQPPADGDVPPAGLDAEDAAVIRHVVTEYFRSNPLGR